LALKSSLAGWKKILQKFPFFTEKLVVVKIMTDPAILQLRQSNTPNPTPTLNLNYDDSDPAHFR